MLLPRPRVRGAEAGGPLPPAALEPLSTRAPSAGTRGRDSGGALGVAALLVRSHQSKRSCLSGRTRMPPSKGISGPQRDRGLWACRFNKASVETDPPPHTHTCPVLRLHKLPQRPTSCPPPGGLRWGRLDLARREGNFQERPLSVSPAHSPPVQSSASVSQRGSEDHITQASRRRTTVRQRGFTTQ